jgi:hypothetical protein
MLHVYIDDITISATLNDTVRSGKLYLNGRFHEIDRCFFCLLLNIYKILGRDFQLDLLGMQLLHLIELYKVLNLKKNITSVAFLNDQENLRILLEQGATEYFSLDRVLPDFLHRFQRFTVSLIYLCIK